MNSIHLTDTQIQQYLFDRENCERNVINHMSLCDACKAEAAPYLMMSSEIKTMQRPVFDFNVADLVFSSLPSRKPKRSFTLPLMYFISAIAIVCLSISIFSLKVYISDTFADIQPSFFYSIVISAIFLVIAQITDTYKIFQQKMTKLDRY